MNDNKLTKILLIILVVVCVFQGCSISSMNATVEGLNNRLIQANAALDNLEIRLEEVESSTLNKQNIQMNVAYKIDKINYETGNIEVRFELSLVHATENTRILVGNGNGKYELTKDGNSFSGIVEYPMNTDEFETIVYQFEGEFEKANQSLEWITAGTLLSEYIGCNFYGFSSYGNGKLTLAGDLDYGMNLNETISSIRLVTGENSQELKKGQKGVVSINISENVEISEIDEIVDIRQVYVEFVSEENITYRVYPYIYAGSTYKVGNEEKKDVRYVTQESWLTIILPDGTEYEMILLSKSEEF